VNTAPLRELGESLVSIYGQNESQTLVRAEVQRQLLDDFGGYSEHLSAVQTAARAVQAADTAITQALAQASRSPADIEFLRHQVAELQGLQLAVGEAEALEAQHRRLANAGRLMADGARAGDLLSGSEGSADDVLSEALQVVAGLANTDASFAEALELLASAQVQLREAASQVQRQLDRLDLDPASLQELERRLSSLHDLARKHRVRLAELPEHAERLAQELADLEQAGSSLERLQAEREQTFARYRKAAAALSDARKNAAAKFAAAITQEARQLGMANAQLLVQVEDAGLERVRSHGADEVRLDFSVNPGQAPRALAKVASGGELSRISLAIQVALLSSASAAAGAPTMVFDEVDAGIGGSVAEIVGQKLRALGASRQVFCVTHLAPVAAQGQAHLGIGKRVVAGSTSTLVTPLSKQARVQEIARMVGGVEITPATEGLAKDLLTRAGQ
jgi:DNA repair protein RecN (Recombination protein N)